MTARPWRILFLVFNRTGVGTYWRAFHFGRCLAARGHAVTLLATSPRARLRSRQEWRDGVCLVEMPDLLPGPLRSGWDPWAAARRLAWLAGRRFDIVHAFEARPTVLFPALLARRRGARLVMDWCDWFGRGGSVEERPNPLLRAVLSPVETYFEEAFRSRADATTVINRFLAGRAQALGAPVESILLLRNGANSEVQPMDKLAARRRLGLPDRAPILGHVGGQYTRDAELMAKAFARVVSARPDAKLLLVGYFNRNIEAMLADVQGVIRTGPVSTDDVYRYLAASDICWVPLRNTGANRGRWPFKLSDYMVVGRPVVATAVGDLGEVISRYELGVVAPDNADEFAAATLALLADVERQLAFGRAARHAAETDFSWERLTDLLEQHYGRL